MHKYKYLGTAGRSEWLAERGWIALAFSPLWDEEATSQWAALRMSSASISCSGEPAEEHCPR